MEINSRAARDSVKEAFFLSFDHSRVLNLLFPRFKPVGEERIGEGTHFEVYLLKTSPLKLVAKVPKPTFFFDQDVRAWFRAIETLQNADWALMPPLAFIETGEEWVMIMPYCPKKALTAEYSDVILAGQNHLDKLGLTIGDLWQIYCCQGVPFVVDLSDLRSACPSHSRHRRR